MPKLGGSPLNLTTATSDNVKGNRLGYSNKINSASAQQIYGGSSSNDLNRQYIVSIFNNTAISPFQTNKSLSEGLFAGSTGNMTMNSDSIGGGDADFDLTINNVLDYTAGYEAMTLQALDFAYLKNIGVFPNNRLMIARRFTNGVQDDLTSLSNLNGLHSPLASLISWVPDNTDFIDITFGEEWVKSDASFRDVLNGIGKDFKASSDNAMGSLGDKLSEGNLIPLPGFMEVFQYEVLKQMGFSDVDPTSLPLGNPNLIRESMRRMTASKEEPFSGLKGKFEIKMAVEYEQKFISGIDPGIAYYSIIANALAFGTSESTFQFNTNFSGSLSGFVSNMTSGTADGLKLALIQFIGVIGKAINAIATDISNALSNAVKTTSTTDTLTTIWNQAAKYISGIINKYKLKILGVINSLSGTPSGPWHVTIGNPKRPVFSSGDMIVDEVKLTMGKILAFNDLPSSVRLEFTLKSARNLGAQEIFKKFNCGKGRSYTRLPFGKKPFVEMDGITVAQATSALGSFSGVKQTSKSGGSTLPSGTGTKTLSTDQFNRLSGNIQGAAQNNPNDPNTTNFLINGNSNYQGLQETDPASLKTMYNSMPSGNQAQVKAMINSNPAFSNSLTPAQINALTGN